MHARHFTNTDQELATTAMASLPAAAGFLLVVFSVIFYGCCGQGITRYNITPDSCDHCLTLDKFASNNTNESVALFLSPGNHTLTRNIEMVGVDQFSILADTSVTIQCASNASFLFEEINNLEIRNTAIVSCGGGGSSGAVQVRSVQQFDFNNVTLQESASTSLNVQDSNGLVAGARFIGNTGAGMNITNSTVAFEGNNTFSNNLDSGIASYDSTVWFIGVNQFTNNTATINGGGISAISSTINCSGNMTFEYNSAERCGGGICLSGTRMTSESHIRFIGNTQANHGCYYRGGGGLCAVEHSVVNINAESDFINNSAERFGGGLSACLDATVNINAKSNFINNSAESGGGLLAYDATVNINAESNFINNSAEGGGGLSAWDATVNINAESNFINNSAEHFGGGLSARGAAVNINAESNFINNSAEFDGGGLNAHDATVNINAESNFINNSAEEYGGGLSANVATVNINAESNFINNSAEHFGGGLSAWRATVNINAESNFINNSAEFEGGGLHAHDATVNINAESHFINNLAEFEGGGLYARHVARVNINAESNFINNSAKRGGGLYARDDTVNINAESNFISNSADEGGGLYAWGATVNISRESNFMCNSARNGGGVYALNAVVNISGPSNFMYNSAKQDGGGVYADDAAKFYISESSNYMCNSAQRYGGAVFLQQSEVRISDNSSFTMNSANRRGGGMCIHTNSITYIRDSFFSDNWSKYGGGISIFQSEIMLQGRTVFSNNTASYGGAIQAIEANVNVTGSIDVTKNLATVNGGALSLAGGSVVYIFETALITFVDNRAVSFGGAIYIEDNCSYDWNINGIFGVYDSTERNIYYCYEAGSDLPSCFKEIASFKENINISFSGNSAVAGSAIFGGEIDEAITNIMFYYDGNKFTTTVADLFQYLFSVSINESNAEPTISSNPNRICGCINDQPDCSDPPSPYEVNVYPGQTVEVSLVAVGQRNGTVPATITAQYDPDDGATFGDLQSTQKSNTTCSELRYTILSSRKTEEVKLNIDGSCGVVEGNPLSVSVTLQECPVGFSPSNSSDQCVCEERLQKYTSNCNISNLEITRTASKDFWVGVDNTNGTEGLILHPHCPFDYCTTDTVNFTLGNASTNTVCTTENKVTVANGSDTNDTKGIDAQCNYNRSGLLCGKCQKGFSLVFGSSKCLKCSNSYLSLLIAFALAGIVLVAFLLVLKLTVAVGTINGLIFYANIVSVNRAQLFPSGETNILTVFIAWVNLDLGIETCFFDGMDAYSKAWLQYAFPIYVWVLVGAIMLASRYSTRITRSLGTNPVAVLATLFLLSYAKLLRSIINPLFFTFLKYPSDTKEVWLVDGNISYLKGKHIPLFLTSLLALFLLFIPFTLLLLLGQWIQAQSERKCFKWISDYRFSTFLDVYHGPFKNKHRYWCGLLLVTRFCLFLVFAFNVNGDSSVNILAIAVCLIGLLVIILQFNVYKAWYLNVLEASFIINLLLLAIGTEILRGNQNALTYTSVSIAFATFCGIVIYHSCLQIKDSKLIEKLHKSYADNSDIYARINQGEDPPIKYAKPVTTTFVEAPK